MSSATASTRQAWDDIADAYDRRITDHNGRIADLALDHLEIRPGAALLDVAAGSGALSLAAARRGADVTAVDLAPAMVERLDRRARDAGLEIDARVMDGQALDLPDGAFDVAASQFGVMLFPDLPAGLAEMRRVTRPGGRVLMVCMAALPPALEFLGFFLGAVRAVAPDQPGPFDGGPPRDLQVADPDALRRRMTEAGLRDIAIDVVDVTLDVSTGQELWDWVTASNPVGGAVVAGLSRDEGRAVREILDGMLRERATDGDGLLHNPMSIAVGVS